MGDQTALEALAWFTGFVGFVIGLILFITFLVMAYRLRRIKEILSDILTIEKDKILSKIHEPDKKWNIPYEEPVKKG